MCAAIGNVADCGVFLLQKSVKSEVYGVVGSGKKVCPLLLRLVVTATKKSKSVIYTHTYSRNKRKKNTTFIIVR